MSKPYDGTDAWWRSELRELAQIVHQIHLDPEKSPIGGWRTCRMASCSRIRVIIDESHRKLDTVEMNVDDIISIKVRREK